MVLEIVLGLAQQKNSGPIEMPAVAVATMEATGTDLSRSVTTPFVYNTEIGTYIPNLHKLHKESTSVNLAFSEVYAIIQGYASGNTKGIYNGTGLPSVETE